MKRHTTSPELLSPAGSYEALLCAVDAGADAVYLGGKQFQARAFSESFDREQMKRALLYARLHGVKTYVTLNTALFDRELEEALDYAAFLYDCGADAVICADLALMALLRAHLPQLPIHASTQAAAHSTAGVDFLADLGAARVVVARELPFTEIEKITERAKAEIEIFLHGALCVSQSGGCLLSAMVGGRSGNRGMCAQPCRLPYNGTYPLSLKDLSLAAHIPLLCESGIASLKIEGRMKSPAYVWHTTRLYRRLIDERRAATKKETEQLMQVFCRGDGFTDGYFTDRKHLPMTGVRTEAQKEATKQLPPISVEPKRVEIEADLTFLAKTPMSLTLKCQDKTVAVTAEPPQPAQKAPLTEQALALRLGKLGDTFFSLPGKNVTVMAQQGLFASVGQINDLRRRATEALEKAFLPAPAAAVAPLPRLPKPTHSCTRMAVFAKKETYEKTDADTLDSFDLHFLPLNDHAAAHPPKGVWMPPIIFDREEAEVKAQLARAKARGATHAMVENIGQIALVREAGLCAVGGLRLNVTNAHTAAILRKAGVSPLFLSPELTAPRARDIGEGVLVYGRVPLMALERCVTKEQGGCAKCGQVSLCDRMGARFPLLPVPGHRSLLFNSLPTYLCDREKEMATLSPLHLFLFTDESADTVRAVTDAARKGQPLPFPTRRLCKEN